MKLVEPIIIDDAKLVSTDVANVESDWASGTYNTGDRVVHNRLVWEALKDSVTSEPSKDTAQDWLKVGYSNIWRMFTEGRDSISTSTDQISVDIKPGSLFSTLAVLNVVGTTVSITVTDDVEGVVHQETKELMSAGVSDFWNWHFEPYSVVKAAVFEGIPPYPNATINITIAASSAGDPVSCGRLVVGPNKDLGVTNYGTSVEILDYSNKERDQFGNLELVKRRVIKTVDYEVSVESSLVDFVVDQLENVAAEPTLYIGDSDKYRSSITFGVYRGAVQGISNPSISELSLQVEEF